MPNREIRLSNASDQTTRSDNPAEKRRKLLSPYCNDGYTKGRDTNGEGWKNRSKPSDHRIENALAIPSTSKSSHKRPADLASVIVSRLDPQDPTRVNGLKGGTPEEAAEYYRSLEQWQRHELNKANENDPYASTQGYDYLQEYKDRYNAPATSAQVGLEHSQQPRTDAGPSTMQEVVEGFSSDEGINIEWHHVHIYGKLDVVMSSKNADRESKERANLCIDASDKLDKVLAKDKQQDRLDSLCKLLKDKNELAVEAARNILKMTGWNRLL